MIFRYGAMMRMLQLLIALACLSCPVHAAVHGHGTEEKGGKRKASPIPDYNPAKQPVTTGEFLLGFIVITFKETVAPEGADQAIRSANQVSSNPQYAETGKQDESGRYSSGVDLKEYFNKYSNEATSPFIGYSPTCVFAKLIAYYRPERFKFSSSKSRSKGSDVDFNQLSWNPSAGDYPMRLEEIDGFFQHVYAQGLKRNFHNIKPEKDFLRSIKEFTGVRSKLVLSQLQPDNLKAVSELIREDLTQSRPVLILFVDGSEPMRWALIDGIGSTGKFHVDFPRNSKFLVDGNIFKPNSGHCVPELLMIPGYKTYLVTSCFYKK